MQKFIKPSLDYIEQNLKTEIKAEELAEMAGYSVWHYYRLFSQLTGSSVLSYILKRRLDHALGEISSGRKAINVVLEYGFDTYAGFYKAFVKMYGCSPKKYLSIYKNKSEVIIMQEKDLRKILENWNIYAGLKIEDITHTDWETQKKSEWQTWEIGNGYYLKTNERSKMLRNIKIAKALEKQGLMSEFLPIATKSGEDYLDGEDIFLLAEKIGEPPPNRPLSDDEIGRLENNDLREKYSFNLGQGMAKLHKAFKEVQDDVKPDENNLYKQVMEWAMPETKKYNQKYSIGVSEDLFDDYTKNFPALFEKLPKQFIHRNPHGGNIVFENGEMAGIIGFEHYNECNVRLFDIIYSAGELNTQPFEIYLKLLTGILKGYDSISPLTNEEKQSIWYVSLSIAMIFIAYLGEMDEDVTRRNREAIVMLAENKEKFYNII